MPVERSSYLERLERSRPTSWARLGEVVRIADLQTRVAAGEPSVVAG